VRPCRARRRYGLSALRRDSRIAAAELALVLALASLPIFGGWVACDGSCVITMDICHSAQSIDVSHAPRFVSPPQFFTTARFPAAAFHAIQNGYREMSGREADAPDPPPPEALL
jgi:hypothetical protein